MVSNHYSKRQFKKKKIYRSKLRGGTPSENKKQKKEKEILKRKQEKERSLKQEQQKEEWSRDFLSKVVRAKTGRMSEEYMEKLMTETRPNDKKHVQITYEFGKQNYLSGRIYEGEWNENRRHGLGKLIEGDTIIYDGEWENGNMVNVQITN